LKLKKAERFLEAAKGGINQPDEGSSLYNYPYMHAYGQFKQAIVGYPTFHMGKVIVSDKKSKSPCWACGQLYMSLSSLTGQPTSHREERKWAVPVLCMRHVVHGCKV